MAGLKIFEGGRSHDDLTVSEAREFMNDHLHEGTPCLVCDRLCKCHRRNISSYFETLQTVDAAAPRGSWVHIADLNLKGGGDYAKLRYWGLMEKGIHDRWRVTLRGHDFLDGKLGVPRFALVFNNICRGLEGDEVYARDLGGGE